MIPMIRAAVFDRAGQPLRIECFARPRLEPGEALARVSLCTICGSDLHTFFGRRKSPSPSVLGHEAVGTIEEIGSELFDVFGERLQIGDRVLWSVAISCGKCFHCKRGLPQKCESLRKYGHEPLSQASGPLGGLTTHCHLLAGTTLVRVPEELPDSVAAPAGCATATIAAVWRAGMRGFYSGLAIPKPQTIIVLGLGMLGLTACAWAASHGHTAIACDANDSRLALTGAFGAAHAVKPATLADFINSSTSGRGADLVLELSGSPEAVRLSLEVLRIGGTAVWAGSVFPSDPVPVLPEKVVRRCLTITGIHNYTPPDLAEAVAFLTKHFDQFPFSELVSRTFPLEAATEAFEFAEKERPIRVAIQNV